MQQAVVIRWSLPLQERQQKLIAPLLPCYPSLRTVDETSTAEATSDLSDAPTAPDACPRTRQSSDSLSATSLRPLPSVTSRTLRSTPSTPCPSSTSRSPTVSRAPSTPTLSECDRALDEGTVLPPFEFATTRMERRVSTRQIRREADTTRVEVAGELETRSSQSVEPMLLGALTPQAAHVVSD